ncbi:hypothetical protein NN561_018428 [Cricetulus griseus]
MLQPLAPTSPPPRKAGPRRAQNASRNQPAAHERTTGCRLPPSRFTPAGLVPLAHPPGTVPRGARGSERAPPPTAPLDGDRSVPRSAIWTRQKIKAVLPDY